jgi:L-fucose isomerase
MKHRIGLLSVSDARERVHNSLIPVIKKYNEQLISFLEASGEVEVILGSEPINNPAKARDEAEKLLHAGVSGTIFHQPVFGFPHFAVIVAQIISTPFLVMAPKEPNYPSINGLLTISAAFAQLEIPHERIWGNVDEERVQKQLLSFVRASSAVRQLRGQVYGILGGRSMGLYGNAPAPNLWIRNFGVDVDHADEFEIVRRVPDIEISRVESGIKWLTKLVSSVQYDETQLTPFKLERQVRSYLATKDLISDHGWDFVGIKCHYEMSEYFATQCLSASFLNDPYDWEGPKEPIIASCEADSDGALTMQILKLLTGLPVTLQDLRFYDEDAGLWVLVNCGASPTWFASQTNDPRMNLAKTKLVPATPKFAGGGAHVWFQFREGPITFARLQRSGETYQLLILKGSIVERELDSVMGSMEIWPVAFVHLDVPEYDLIRNFNANHLHGVIGDYTEDLQLVGKFLKIEVLCL